MKKNKQVFLKAASVLGIVFAAAAAINLDGYNLFDREDGKNPLCQIDPACRKLTPGEMAMVKDIFGNTIDYKPVKIFNRRPPVPRSEGSVMKMWNKNIYAFEDEFKTSDYSTTGRAESRESFIHEITHIWQYENDTKFFIRGFFSLFQQDFDYGKLYPYNIDDHKDFAHFNFEQQARIVEHYYHYKIDFREKTKGLFMGRPADFNRDFNRATRNLCRTLDKYTLMVSQALPQELEPGCAMYRPYEKPPVDPYRDVQGP